MLRRIQVERKLVKVSQTLFFKDDVIQQTTVNIPSSSGSTLTVPMAITGRSLSRYFKYKQYLQCNQKLVFKVVK